MYLLLLLPVVLLLLFLLPTTKSQNRLKVKRGSEAVVGCGERCAKKCDVNYGGYEITPLRQFGYDYIPLHDVWKSPDYLSPDWCPVKVPEIEWIDPPYIDYRIPNPTYCYNLPA